MIIDTHLHPTNLVDEAWRHTGTPFNGERMLQLMDGPYTVSYTHLDVYKRQRQGGSPRVNTPRCTASP